MGTLSISWQMGRTSTAARAELPRRTTAPYSRGMRIHRLPFILSVLLAGTSLAATLDGPYIFRTAEGLQAWTIESDDTGPHKHLETLKAGATVQVAAVGSLPAFDVLVRKGDAPPSDEIKMAANNPLFVVADTHGEYENFADLLIAHRVIDARLKWRYGRGHLAILGDVFDRGAHHTEILWLIYSLETQARKAGGGVHFVLGNHEVMTMQGDHRYLNPRYLQTVELSGWHSYSDLFSEATVLGQWLRSLPAVLKINDLLLLHGGISPALVERKLPLATINTSLREALHSIPPRDAEARDRAELLFGASGPLWYRGYFPDRNAGIAATQSDVSSMLAYFGVHRILVGHTIVPAITPLYDGKVIAVNVVPLEGLLVRGGKFYRAKPDGTADPLDFPR